MASQARALHAFDISVLGADSHVWLSVNASQGSVHGVPRRSPNWVLPASDARPSDWLTRVVGSADRTAQTDAVAIGEALRELVFGVPEVVSLFHLSRGAAAAAGAQLLVRVLAAPQEISSWPWELLIDPQRPGEFLTMARDVHVVRAGRSRTYPVRTEPVQPPLNLLLVLSSPLRSSTTEDETPFDLYGEKRALLEELRPLVERGLLAVEVEERPTVERLRERIGRQRRGFHLLHYLGHAQPNGLNLERAGGTRRLVPGADFAALLQQMPDLRLAVFAGCETARSPSDPGADEWPGTQSIADCCVRDASPMVIGMQAVLPFGTERLFTRFFYQALTSGHHVAEALRLARLAIADDQFDGRPLANWSVPALFVGGSLPGAVLDPAAKALPVPRAPRVATRYDPLQGELRFTSRFNEMRQALDVLSARRPARLLQVVGGRGSGKSAFLDRVAEELDDDILVLMFPASRLLRAVAEPELEADPTAAVAMLGTLVSELLKRGRRKVTARGERVPQDWWVQLLEDLADVPMAILIDDADDLISTDPTGPDAAWKRRAGDEILAALSELTRRRGKVRLALASRADIPSLSTRLRAGQVFTIALKALDWDDIWLWIRRNLPILSKYGKDALAPFYSDLSHLESWERLAEKLIERPSTTVAELPAVVASIRTPDQTTAVSAGRGNTGAVSDLPIFGIVPSRGAEPTDPDLSGERDEPAASAGGAAPGVLRIAVTGQLSSDSVVEFTRLATGFAAGHGVSGRVMSSATMDVTSSLAELVSLPMESDDPDAGAVPPAGLAGVERLHPDIVVLEQTMEGDLQTQQACKRLVASGALVIARTDSPRPVAARDAMLSVGVLGEDLPTVPLPDVYVSPSVTATGSWTPARYAAAAATVIWATDRGQSAADVRRTLIDTASVVQAGGHTVRVLDVPAALRATRRQLLVDALQNEPLELGQLLATTGLRAEVALPIIEELVAEGVVNRTRLADTETLEDPHSLTQQYVNLRTLPYGRERTRSMNALAARAGQLARRNRYTRERVSALWESGHEGRRIVALGVMVARPDLALPNAIAEAISAKRSSFEQYQALLAAEEAWDTLSPAEHQLLKDEITRARPGEESDQRGVDSSRAVRAHRLLAR